MNENESTVLHDHKHGHMIINLKTDYIGNHSDSVLNGILLYSFTVF